MSLSTDLFRTNALRTNVVQVGGKPPLIGSMVITNLDDVTNADGTYILLNAESQIIEQGLIAGNILPQGSMYLNDIATSSAILAQTTGIILRLNVEFGVNFTGQFPPVGPASNFASGLDFRYPPNTAIAFGSIPEGFGKIVEAHAGMGFSFITITNNIGQLVGTPNRFLKRIVVNTRPTVGGTLVIRGGGAAGQVLLSMALTPGGANSAPFAVDYDITTGSTLLHAIVTGATGHDVTLVCA